MHDGLVAKPMTRADWDRMLPTFRDASYRQCGAYAEAAARTVRARAEFVGIFAGRDLLGLASLRVKTLPMLPLGIAYVNYGPLTMTTDVFDSDRFAAVVAALEREYVGRRRLLLRVAAPQGGGRHNDIQTASLSQRGFRSSTQPQRLETFILDLDRPLSTIRASFDQKWRASLTKAQKADLAVTRSRDPADFERFEVLYDRLSQRKGFFAHQGAAFFSGVSQEAVASDQLILHLATENGELVAGNLCSFVGDTALLILAAANPRGRELLASFVLQWAVIEHARSVGNEFYDLGGVDPVANPDVYRFKKRLGGRNLTSAGSFDLAPDPMRKMAMSVMEDTWAAIRATRARHARSLTGPSAAA